MTKVKIEKIIVISFIGLFVAIFVGLGGNIVLKAGLPASVSKTEVNFEKRLQILEDDLVTGNITRYEYDSLAEQIRLQIKRSEVLQDESHNPDKMPDWVTKLGISEPKGMKFDQDFSNYTSFEDPSERFNSVSLVYNGSYEKAVKEAARIASNAKLTLSRIFEAEGRPVREDVPDFNTGVSYLNYSLGNTDQNYLISVQVEPSGRLILTVTDNKQLNECLLAYEPLNNRQNSAAKPKKH
jgi:hypothetical protein